MFLSPEELQALTGYQLHAWQRKWLDKHSWCYAVAASGRPIVAKNYANSRLVPTEVTAAPEPTLNFDCFKEKRA